MKKKSWLYAIGMAFFGLLSTGVAGWLFKGETGKDYFLVVQYIVPILFVVVLLQKSGRWNLLTRTKSFGKGVGLIWPLVIPIGLNLLSILGRSKVASKEEPAFAVIFLLGTMCLLLGIFEETLFRGLILDTFSKVYSKKAAAFFSALLFGLFHIGNVTNPQTTWLEVVSQVVYTGMLGVFFASIYQQVNNLWILILAHGILDFTGLFPTVFLSEMKKTGEINGQGVVVLWVSVLPAFLWGCHLLKKSEKYH